VHGALEPEELPDDVPEELEVLPPELPDAPEEPPSSSAALSSFAPAASPTAPPPPLVPPEGAARSVGPPLAHAVLASSKTSARAGVLTWPQGLL